MVERVIVMIIQIKGKVNFNITLDPSTFIFDDRKVEMDTIKKTIKLDDDTISFQDNYEWNREILEGGSKPPTLVSEKKYKKQQLLEGTFLMNLEPFIRNAEPHQDATRIRLTNETDSAEIHLDALPNFYVQFSKDGKRLYDDGMVDAYLLEDTLNLKLAHVTGIEII